MKLDDVLLEYEFAFDRDTIDVIDAMADNPELMDGIYLIGDWEDVRDYLLKNFDFERYGVDPKKVDWYAVADAMSDEYQNEMEEVIKMADADMDQF